MRPGSWPAARARVAESTAFLASVGADAIDAAAEQPLAHDLLYGMMFDMTGASYVRAHALLRQAGVPLGKVDYVPHMFGYLRPGTAAAA